MMEIKRNAAMIGEFTDRGLKLFSEKAVGNVHCCMGFVTDKRLKLNVPNTLLKKDIRDVTAPAAQKVYAVLSKGYQDDKYHCIEKIDKALNISEDIFGSEIEQILNRADT